MRRKYSTRLLALGIFSALFACASPSTNNQSQIKITPEPANKEITLEQRIGPKSPEHAKFLDLTRGSGIHNYESTSAYLPVDLFNSGSLNGLYTIGTNECGVVRVSDSDASINVYWNPEDASRLALGMNEGLEARGREDEIPVEGSRSVAQIGSTRIRLSSEPITPESDAHAKFLELVEEYPQSPSKCNAAEFPTTAYIEGKLNGLFISERELNGLYELDERGKPTKELKKEKMDVYWNREMAQAAADKIHDLLSQNEYSKVPPIRVIEISQ